MKPTNGHKCLGVSYYIKVKCECGWESGAWGKDFQSSAYQEWRQHRDTVHKERITQGLIPESGS